MGWRSWVAAGCSIQGRAASWGELSRALGYLLASSVLSLVLLNGGTVAVQLLATPAQEVAAGQFLTARIIAFIPVYLFQAVPAALLPRLSRLAASGRFAEFRKVLLELVVFVGLLGTVGIAVLAALGPVASHLLFGSAFDLGHLDYALLSAAGAVFMLGIVLGQSLIALSGYPRAAAGTLAGVVSFVVVTAFGSQLFLRVELGLLAGAIASSGVMAMLLVPLIRARARVDTEPRIAKDTLRVRLVYVALIGGSVVRCASADARCAVHLRASERPRQSLGHSSHVRLRHHRHVFTGDGVHLDSATMEVLPTQRGTARAVGHVVADVQVHGDGVRVTDPLRRSPAAPRASQKWSERVQAAGALPRGKWGARAGPPHRPC